MQDEFNDPLWRQIISGAQMLFVAFGALVLMPLITGLDPNVALFTAGLGTLLFQLVTGRQVPVFLAFPEELRTSRRVTAFRDFVLEEIQSIRKQQAEDEAARRAVYRIFGEFLLERVATEGGFELAQGVERIHVAECG